MQAMAQRLREKGLKVTPQRLAIYAMLTSTTAHPTAEAIWDEIKQDYPAVSFNTVYTTLGTLEQAGLVQRLSIGGNRAHYDANVAPHIHLCCENCGQVEDYGDDYDIDLLAVGQRIMERASYALGKVELNLYGVCLRCIKAH